MSDKVLTETLRRLEDAGFVTRDVVPSIPIEVDYALTELAESLWPLLSDLASWTRGHTKGAQGSRATPPR